MTAFWTSARSLEHLLAARRLAFLLPAGSNYPLGDMMRVVDVARAVATTGAATPVPVVPASMVPHLESLLPAMADVFPGGCFVAHAVDDADLWEHALFRLDHGPSGSAQVVVIGDPWSRLSAWLPRTDAEADALADWLRLGAATGAPPRLLLSAALGPEWESYVPTLRKYAAIGVLERERDSTDGHPPSVESARAFFSGDFPNVPARLDGRGVDPSPSTASRVLRVNLLMSSWQTPETGERALAALPDVLAAAAQIAEMPISLTLFADLHGKDLSASAARMALRTHPDLSDVHVVDQLSDLSRNWEHMREGHVSLCSSPLDASASLSVGVPAAIVSLDPEAFDYAAASRLSAPVLDMGSDGDPEAIAMTLKEALHEGGAIDALRDFDARATVATFAAHRVQLEALSVALSQTDAAFDEILGRSRSDFEELSQLRLEFERLLRMSSELRNGSGAGSTEEYATMMEEVRQLVHAQLPRRANVLVVSKGDDELLNLYGRLAAHFPQQSDGMYAGHYPEDDDRAVRHLEELRQKGWQYIVFPQTSLWWLREYPRFAAHLNNRYGRVARDDAVAAIYDLRGPAERSKGTLGSAGGQRAAHTGAAPVASPSGSKSTSVSAPAREQGQTLREPQPVPPPLRSADSTTKDAAKVRLFRPFSRRRRREQDRAREERAGG